MTAPGTPAGEPRAPRAAVGALALVAVCCGGHALLLAGLGGVAIGGAVGIGAGVLAAVVIVIGVIVGKRRGASCRIEREAAS